MQFMLDIYELSGMQSDPQRYPQKFVVDFFHGYQPQHAYETTQGNAVP